MFSPVVVRPHLCFQAFGVPSVVLARALLLLLPVAMIVLPGVQPGARPTIPVTIRPHEEIVPPEGMSALAVGLGGEVATCSPLFSGVGHVFRPSTGEEVVWIDAPPVVAAVTDFAVGRDRTECENEGITMSLDRHVRSNLEVAVAIVCPGAHPCPATFGLVDLRPKPLFRSHSRNVTGGSGGGHNAGFS